MSLASSLAPLRTQAQQLLDRAYVPFSSSPVAAVLLLEDGTWIPGVRIESASYSLTIPALLNAFTTAEVAQRAGEIVAVVLSRAHRPEEALYVEQLPHGPFDTCDEDIWLRRERAGDGALPALQSPLSPFLDATVDAPEEGIEWAQRIADRAYAPASNYPVGAVLELEDRRLVPGVNVEHADWSRTLCAERSALGTVLSYDAPAPQRLFLSCPKDPEGTPCGACRQLMAELAPNTTLWMDRHSSSPESTTVSTLLPGSFRGRVLLGDQ